MERLNIFDRILERNNSAIKPHEGCVIQHKESAIHKYGVDVILTEKEIRIAHSLGINLFNVILISPSGRVYDFIGCLKKDYKSIIHYLHDGSDIF